MKRCERVSTSTASRSLACPELERKRAEMAEKLAQKRGAAERRSWVTKRAALVATVVCAVPTQLVAEGAKLGRVVRDTARANVFGVALLGAMLLAPLLRPALVGTRDLAVRHADTIMSTSPRAFQRLAVGLTVLVMLLLAATTAIIAKDYGPPSAPRLAADVTCVTGLQQPIIVDYGG